MMVSIHLLAARELLGGLWVPAHGRLWEGAFWTVSDWYLDICQTCSFPGPES